MRRTSRYVGMVFCLCAPFLATGQDQTEYRANSERATQVAASVEQTIKAKEPKWRLKNSHSEGAASSQLWKSGVRELELRIFVYDSSEEASRMLSQHGAFEVANSEKLEGLGEEARYISHPYFSWVGVRQGRLLAVVHGPGKELDLTKRFAQYALTHIGGK